VKYEHVDTPYKVPQRAPLAALREKKPQTQPKKKSKEDQERLKKISETLLEMVRRKEEWDDESPDSEDEAPYRNIVF
jgi:hypothetical protein